MQGYFALSGKIRICGLGFHWFIWVCFVGFAFAACTPEATPFPVDIPTPQGSQLSSDSTAAIRYALAANTTGNVSDLPQLETNAQVETLTDAFNPDDLGTQYDLIAAYGDLPGGTRSPTTLHISLIINPARSPFDKPEMVNLLRQSLDTATIVNALAVPGAEANLIETTSALLLRTELANNGWPDGVTVSVAYADAPGASQIAGQLKLAGIHTQLNAQPASDILPDLISGNIQISIIPWRTEDERAEWAAQFGDSSLIDLYTVPISYLALPGLNITFTPGGWPLPSR